MFDPLVVCSYGGPIVTDLRFRRQYLHERKVLLERHMPRFRAGRIDALTVPVDSLDDLAVLLTEIEEAGGQLRLVQSPAEVRTAKQDGVIALMLGVTFKAVGSTPDVLQIYRHFGAALFPLALNPRNLLTDGCGERTQAGLSYYGCEVVERVARMGALIDVSHTSDAGFDDVARIVSGPFVASHSNSRVVCPNPRNLTDAQAQTIAAHGGFVALSTYPTLVASGPQPSLDDYLDHVDHFVRLIGAEHVAVGADFVDHVRDLVMPGIKGTDPTGEIYGQGPVETRDLASIADIANVADGLAQRGYSEQDRALILGENVLRVWELARAGTQN